MADTSAPARPAREAVHTVVSRVDRVSAHVLRVVLGGPGLEGFPAGAFTDPPGHRAGASATLA